MALRIEPALKKFFKEYADKEQRSLSNFLIHAGIRYIRNQWKIDWDDVRLSYIKAAEKADAEKKSK